MARAGHYQTLYEALEALPEGLTGEILDGQLHTQPRPAGMPAVPSDQRFEIVPDWVCEILSPSTRSKDREIKMPLYARYGVAYAWLLAPLAQTLETYQLRNGEWAQLANYDAQDAVSAVPFEAAVFQLAELSS